MTSDDSINACVAERAWVAYRDAECAAESAQEGPRTIEAQTDQSLSPDDERTGRLICQRF